MTRERAIKIIEQAKAVVLNNGEYDKAMSMAIDALSVETPTIQEKHQLSEVDTQTVFIDGIGHFPKLSSAEVIKKLECSKGKKIVRCKDCKHYDQAWDKRGACFNSKGVFGILNDDDYCSYGERREP